MKALILLARNTGMLFALFSALPFVSRGESAAVFENKTKSTADIRVIGPDTVSASVQSNATKRLELKGGEYYFKIRFLSVDSPRYAVGPYFSLVDEPLLKHEVRIALEGPSSLYEITKQEFEDDTKDSALLRKANQSSKAWTRWAGIVLDIVTEEQERDSQMGFKGLAQISTEPITSKDYQGLNVGILSGGTTATIEQIIKKHGKPTRVGDVKTRTLKKPVNGKLVEESFETEEFHFDGIIWLECRKDNGKVQWLYAPTMWFIEGIRKKAQRTIERTK